MTPKDANDPMLHDLSRLPLASPDMDRSARVRRRCHGVLARHQPRVTDDERPAGSRERTLELVIAGVLCVVYLSAVIEHALRLRGIL